MERRQKLHELDLVRAIAIIGVLMVHATSAATVTMLDTSSYGFYNFLNNFFRIGTTTFIFMSSFVLFYNYYPQPLTAQRFKKFYRNRLSYIVIPYVLFSGLYFTVKWYMNDKAWDLSVMLPRFWDQLLVGKAHEHLYFVFINIQLYVLFPIILLLFKRYRWMAASAIVIGLALQWGFFILNREYWQVTNRGSWSLSYFGQYFLGAWCGIYFDRIKSWLIIAKENVRRSRMAVWIVLWATWLGFGITHVTFYYQMKLLKVYHQQKTYDMVWDIYTMLTPLVLLQIAFLIGSRMGRSWIVDALRHLGVVSFGVYLIHPLVLMVYRKYPLGGGGTMLYHLWYAGGFVCALGISWIAVTILSRLTGWSWLVFGSVPGQLQATYGAKPTEKRPVAPSA